MNASTTAVTTGQPVAAHSSSVYGTSAFWDWMWRTSGLQFVGFFIVTAAVYGYQPAIGASANQLLAFYDYGRVRVLAAAALSGLNILNLLWFAAALRATLADAERDGWGAAATVSSAVFGGLSIVSLTISAALAYSIVGSGNDLLASGLNDFSWALAVLTSFPRAMLIMSGAFGLWRAGLISNALFAAGVGAVVLAVLGGTTWLSDGFWAPDGAFSRFVSPALLLAWVVVVSRVLLARGPAARGGW